MSSAPLLAQAAPQGGGLYVIVVVLAALLVMLAVLALVFAKCYVRCPSNRVLVVYGRDRAMCLHGGARFVLPLFEDYDWLSLEPMEIEIPLRGALSAEKIRVNMPSLFTVAIGTTPELMQNAATCLLGLTEAEVKRQAGDILFGQLRVAIASTPLDQIYLRPDEFLEKLQSSIEAEFSKIGLVLINVNILEITDDSGYLEAFGRKATTTALVERLLAAFDGSVPRLVAYLLEEGKLSDDDRREIRRVLDAAGASP